MLCQSGEGKRARGEFEAGRAALQQAIDIARATDDKEIEGHALHTLALYALDERNAEEGKSFSSRPWMSTARPETWRASARP